MIKLLKQERRILTDIFGSSNGLFIFTIHRQLNLSPNELFAAIEKLKSNGLIDVIDDRATLTKVGAEYAVKTSLKTKIGHKKQNLIKENFLGKRININEFYIPQKFEK
ncbi:MAG: hypothetical protein Q8R57_01920 [Bacteroidota bacterium]|nr:hypothetical protein [Bacteroidota bacterium]